MISHLVPHHDPSPLYVSEQAPAPGAVVGVRIRVPHRAGVGAVHVRTTPDGEQFFSAARVVQRDELETWWQAEITCHNPVTNYRFLLDGDPEVADATAYRWFNGTGVHERDVPDAHDFRVVTYPAPPSWAADSVVYQVFPDRFARDSEVEPATGDGGPRTDLPAWAVAAGWDEPLRHGPRGSAQVYGGTLKGIADRLDHLVDLGVNVLYLTPFFPARSNHRYDASSFTQVDPLLGGEEALVRLQEQAHTRGIRVLGDITTNHTGDAHEWYVAAVADPEGPFGDFYVRHPERTGEWVSWLGVPTLPKLNHRNEQVRAALTEGSESVIQRWLGPGRGLDGWRVDVANMTGRYREVDLTHQVARDSRAAVDEATGGQGLLVAEHTHDHSGDAAGDGWHGVMNYSGFTRPLWTWLAAPGFAPKFLGSPTRVPRLGAEQVAETMREFTALVPWRTVAHSMTLVGSHDTTRVRTLVGEDRALVRVAAALLVTMPGIPMITYGDEIGMIGDFGEDGRRPMPWQARGADDERWDELTLDTYRELIAMRRGSPALSHGGMRWLHAQDDVMVFVREHPAQSALVHVARAGHGPVDLPALVLPGMPDGGPRLGEGIEVSGDSVRVSAAGPSVSVWTWETPAPQWSPVPEEYRGGW